GPLAVAAHVRRLDDGRDRGRFLLTTWAHRQRECDQQGQGDRRGEGRQDEGEPASHDAPSYRGPTRQATGAGWRSIGVGRAAPAKLASGPCPRPFIEDRKESGPDAA